MPPHCIRFGQGIRALAVSAVRDTRYWPRWFYCGLASAVIGFQTALGCRMVRFRCQRLVSRASLFATVVFGAVLAISCGCTQDGGAPQTRSVEHERAETSNHELTWDEALRSRMVSEQLAARDITNQRVLEAMGRVPRHKFVPPGLERFAYEDRPLPIGQGQTISQPYIVALMTQVVDPRPGAKALDIGTGSGYQAAVLAELTKQVYSIEIIGQLAEEARQRLARLGYRNIEVRHGDGYRGWPEHAPFDIIVVAAAPDHVPEPLVEQLAPGGKMVIPVGERWQELIVVEKTRDGKVVRRHVAPVAFVPMTGEAEKGQNDFNTSF